MILILDAEQAAAQSAIEPMQLGCFHQTLAEVAVMRLDQTNQSAGLQHTQPRLGGVDGHPGISSQR